jgi:hypothetical protein
MVNFFGNNLPLLQIRSSGVAHFLPECQSGLFNLSVKVVHFHQKKVAHFTPE